MLPSLPQELFCTAINDVRGKAKEASSASVLIAVH
jgi:hypothetical protein